MTLRNELAGRRKELQLETLHDLVIALHSHASEQDLVDDLVERVCGVVDPAAAVAVTRDPFGQPRATTLVGWENARPSSAALLDEPIWKDLLSQGRPVERSDGTFAGRHYHALLAAPIVCREVFLGYVVVLDRESRRGEASVFRKGDRRFVASVSALAGVALDSLRKVESLKHESERLAEENKFLREREVEEVAGTRIVAGAPAMRSALDIVRRVAPRNVTVLVRGESGTGKELVARFLHHLSERSGSLVAVNCAALPESLMESELFGIEGGVATGVQARAGRFELADGGTLFLDEIGDLDPTLQVKLLRALQEREVTRVGGARPIPVDVRVVAATHQPLEQRVEQGRFREDLYYRLKGIEVELPPLRERRQDLAQLVRYFAERFCKREGIEMPQFEQSALALLMTHDFPGNVRELQNLVEGALSLADGPVDADLLTPLMGGTLETTAAAGPEALDLESVERRHIGRVLQLTEGNKSAAARLLGLDRRTLSRKGY